MVMTSILYSIDQMTSLPFPVVDMDLVTILAVAPVLIAHATNDQWAGLYLTHALVVITSTVKDFR